MRLGCENPYDIGTLADYWLALLAPAEEAPLEEHLLGCDECSGRLAELAALADGIKMLARHGTLRLIVSQSFLDRAAAQGLRIREYAPPAGGSVNCTVTLQDNLLIARLAADLSGVQRVDLSFRNADGTERGRLRDIPFSRARGDVILNESIDAARASGPDVLCMKLLAIDEQGERVIGDYTFNHTPS
jgi:hypothetical protein